MPSAVDAQLWADDVGPADLKGEILLARSQCFSCHQADPETAQRIQTLAAPDLSLVGRSFTAGWLQKFIGNPKQTRPHTRMPSLLNSMEIIVDSEIAEDLTAYLLDASGGFEFVPIEVQPEDIELGEKLFYQLGCLPCHEHAFADDLLAEQSSVNQLRDFLLEPNKVRPGTLMPDSGLQENEAKALAAWLLRDQRMGEPQQIPGLKYSYFEQENWPTEGPVDWASMQVLQQGTAEIVHDNYGRRRERYGLVFEGLLQVPEAGDYEFSTTSDDGSELFLDGVRIVENLGHHGDIQVTSESIPLEAGFHELRITFFEQSGGEVLRAGWSGPDFEAREFRANELFHNGVVPRPIWDVVYTPEPERVERGAKFFQTLGCSSCHTSPSGEPAKPNALPWAELRASERGCLSNHPDSGVASYHFDWPEPGFMLALLKDRTILKQAHALEDAVQRSMELLQCNRCHSRNDLGGPGELQQHFTSADDLGEEGRIPPDLSGVGNKLRANWLHRVIAEGLAVRPAMHTRMPAFGDATAKFMADHFRAADLATAVAHPSAAPPAFDEHLAEVGHLLIGSDGMACIACHGVADYPSIGIQGPDLAGMYERLQPQWFRRWMLDPTKMRPGTRMLAYFPNGTSIKADVLEGDPEQQIDALWQYMSLGRSMPLPIGLVLDRSEFALLPQDRVLYFGTFMQGLSARVLTVGFPERVSLAFDSAHVRLAKLWQGNFLNAQGTWQGRAGQLEVPAGSPVVDLPEGPAFAWLADASQRWPSVEQQAEYHQLDGHRRDAEGHPTFLYQLEIPAGEFAGQQVRIEESLSPVVRPGRVGITRRFVIHSEQEIPGLYLRVAREAAIEELDDGSFLAKIGNLRWQVSKAQLRNSSGSTELLVPLEFSIEGAAYQAKIEVKMSW